MRIDVVAKDVATGASDKALLRECTRFALLAECLCRLGCDVALIDAADLFRRSIRWGAFGVPYRGSTRTDADVRIIAAEAPAKWSARTDAAVVRYKTKVNNSRDRTAVSNCDILMTHEVSAEFHWNPAVLHVPFLVGDAVIEHWLVERTRSESPYRGMWNAYVSDDLETIRGRYSGTTKTNRVGFIGYNGYGRKRTCERLNAATAGRVDFELYASAPYGPADYLARLQACAAGLILEGVTPKSNRFSETVLMGVPCVFFGRDRQPLCPRLDDTNSIELDTPDDADELYRGLERSEDIVANADIAYRCGWSAMGQAKQLLKRLDALYGQTIDAEPVSV